MASPSSPPRRRTQAERTAATRERLLLATFESLVEVGYARTSTPEVLRRSGVSRGALLHHFPTKSDLVTAAVDYVFERQLREYRETFGQLEDTVEDRAAEAIELLWTKLSGDTFYAWLELIVAARTDPVLEERVREVTHR
jgi:AcrR family transcriptional regulator